MHGPSVPFSQQLYKDKYLTGEETFAQRMTTIAKVLADNNDHETNFRDSLLNMRFLPAGRVQSSIGAERQVTPYNCFVSGTIEDSFVDGSGSIMDRAKEAAATMRMGGGIGYDFSTLRPKGSLIKKLGTFSNGPLSFMEIFDSICQCVSSAGHRRGAQMGVLRIDHPDIEAFISAKRDNISLNGFNISVAVTNEFMKALENDLDFDLMWDGEPVKSISARKLWDDIMLSNWDWAEPGVLFIDNINSWNNLYYCEQIAATNPCAEQPLPPHGACLLGSFNLVKYLEGNFFDTYSFNWDLFSNDISHVVRAMDNIVDVASYPLSQQELEATSKRRMGLGVTGLANCLEALGMPYGSPQFLVMQGEILAKLRDIAYMTSALLAKEKGVFPEYDEKSYLHGEFIQSLPPEVRSAIKEHGIRNSHLTSIAPTGTISLCADNVSSGIEPVFSYGAKRQYIAAGNESREELVEDYGLKFLGVRGKQSHEVTLKEHLDVLTTAQTYVDSAVSKTCNVGAEVTFDEFKEVYFEAWRNGCKGCTTFRLEGKRYGMMEPVDEPIVVESVNGQQLSVSDILPPINASVEACYVDPTTGVKNCS